MNFKKIAAGITAAVCCAGVMTYLPKLSEKTFAQSAVYNDFEVNYDGWYGNADTVKIIAENQRGYENTRGMVVSGRQSSSDGVSSSKGFYLSGGVNYNYIIKVYSNTNEKFRLSLLCIDMDTNEETTVQLSEKDVTGGEWTEISAEYTAPKNSCEFKLTLTTDSTNDFSFDDVNITSEQNTNTVYAATAQKGLKDEFAPYFRVGNILNGGTVQKSEITANIIKDYNSIECENETKPDATMVQSQCSGTNIGVTLQSAAAIFDFCIKNNIAVRGHTLVWHSQTPQWFFKEGFKDYGNWVSSTVMDQRMESYIKNLFAAIKQQYPALNLYAYDVANECISDNDYRTANNGGTREPGYGDGKSPWVQVYGSNDFVEKAFYYAKLYAPAGCALYYNDYNEYWDHKRDCIYNMCKKLYNKKLLDGVGMQSHVPANATGFAGTDSYITAMKKYLSIGCDVQITELDISLENGKYSLQDQANKYKAIFQAAMDWNKNPQSSGRVTLVAIWGPNDANSWLSAGSNALLYDANNQPKAAYTTLTSMIPQSQWGDGSNYQGSSGGGGSSTIEPNEYGWYFHDEFEKSLCDWQFRGTDDMGKIATSGRTAYKGDESLGVYNRKNAWNGAVKTLNSRAFESGKEYSFSANITYYDGDDTDQFSLTLQYKDASGETKYATIATGTVGKGQWVQLSNKSFKIPSDATSPELVIESTKTTNNFYIDEVIGAVGGTTILGAGEYKEPVVTTATTAATTKATTSTSVVTKASTAEIKGAVIDESKYFMIKNMNSGQFMEVADGKAEAGANVQQNTADSNVPSANNVWRFKKLNKDWDLYYIYSAVGDGNTFVLNCGGSNNGTNINIEKYSTTNTPQNFVMLENADGSYTMLTRSSYNKNTGYKSCVEVVNASNDNGANIQQWETNNHNCQKWRLVPVKYNDPAVTTVTTTSSNVTTETTTSVSVKPDANGWYFHDEFEGSLCDWEIRGGDDMVRIATSGRTSYKGNESLGVYDRKYDWNGIVKKLDTRAFMPGKAYSFSAHVSYGEGNDTEQFYFAIQYKDSSGNAHYDTIASGTVGKQTWVQLANKSFTIPEDAIDLELFIQTSGTTNNFYVDEIIGAVDGTVIEGAGEYQKPVVTTTTTATTVTTKTTTTKATTTKATTKATTTKITTKATTTKTTTKATTTKVTTKATTTKVTTKATTTKATTKATTTTTIKTKIPGDINDDGKVSVADIIEMQKYLIKAKTITSEIFKQLDFNGDGKFNVFDFIAFKKLLLSSPK